MATTEAVEAVLKQVERLSEPEQRSLLIELQQRVPIEPEPGPLESLRSLRGTVSITEGEDATDWIRRQRDEWSRRHGLPTYDSEASTK